MILVGTHLDASEEPQLQSCLNRIRAELLSHQGFPAIRDFHMVSSCDDSDAMTRLREAIVKEVKSFKVIGRGPYVRPYAEVLRGHKQFLVKSCSAVLNLITVLWD